MNINNESIFLKSPAIGIKFNFALRNVTRKLPNELSAVSILPQSNFDYHAYGQHWSSFWGWTLQPSRCLLLANWSSVGFFTLSRNAISNEEESRAEGMKIDLLYFMELAKGGINIDFADVIN